MTMSHEVTLTEIGMLRIYMKPSETIAPRRARKLWSARPLYRELVVQAKADGLMNAIAHHTHYGFSNHGPVRENGAEIADPHLTICVELIGQRGELEEFCERHGDLLADKVIVYKHLEHWTINRSGLRHEDVSTAELSFEQPLHPPVS